MQSNSLTMILFHKWGVLFKVKWALLLLEQRQIQHISREGLSSSSHTQSKLLSKEDESSTLYE